MECGHFVRQFGCCIQFTNYNKITTSILSVVAIVEIGSLGPTT